MISGCNNVIAWTLLALTTVVVAVLAWYQFFVPGVVCGVLGLIVSLSPRIVKDWDRGVRR